MSKPLLQVSDLHAHFISFRGQRAVKAVDGVSFSLEEGETLGLVGESGCGKTTTCHTLFRLLPSAGRIISGRIEFAGEDLMQKSPAEMQRIRGRDMAMILQDPMVSLNPLFNIFNREMVGIGVSRLLHHASGFGHQPFGRLVASAPGPADAEPVRADAEGAEE